jgi:hypothetical protein
MLSQTLQLQSSQLMTPVVTLGALLQIWQWAGCGKEQCHHMEEAHNANVCPARLSHPAACPVPDLYRGPIMSLKMAPVMFTKMSGNLSSVQRNPKADSMH